MYGLVAKNDLAEVENCCQSIYDQGYMFYEKMWLPLQSQNYKEAVKYFMVEEDYLCL